MAVNENKKPASGRFTIVPAPGPAYQAREDERAAIREIRRVSERAKGRIATSGRTTKPR
jgi:hypothetical protein